MIIGFLIIGPLIAFALWLMMLPHVMDICEILLRKSK